MQARSKCNAGARGKPCAVSFTHRRLSVSNSFPRRENRQNFPSSDTEKHGSRKLAQTPPSATLRRRSQANKSQTLKNPLQHSHAPRLWSKLGFVSVPSRQRGEQSVSGSLVPSPNPAWSRRTVPGPSSRNRVWMSDPPACQFID